MVVVQIYLRVRSMIIFRQYKFDTHVLFDLFSITL